MKNYIPMFDEREPVLGSSRGLPIITPGTAVGMGTEHVDVYPAGVGPFVGLEYPAGVGPFVGLEYPEGVGPFDGLEYPVGVELVV